MPNNPNGAVDEGGNAEARPQWSTPHLSLDAVTDVTATVILAPGIDNYEASSPNDGS